MDHVIFAFAVVENDRARVTILTNVKIGWLIVSVLVFFFSEVFKHHLALRAKLA